MGSKGKRREKLIIGEGLEKRPIECKERVREREMSCAGLSPLHTF